MTRVIIEFEGEADLSHQDKDQIRLLMLDALYEFWQRRSSPHSYVEKGYDWMSDKQKILKIGEVSGRIRIAKWLHCALRKIQTKTVTEGEF